MANQASKGRAGVAPSLRPISDEEYHQVRARLDNMSRALTQTSDEVRHWRGTAEVIDPPRALVDWAAQQLLDAARMLYWCNWALQTAKEGQAQTALHSGSRRTKTPGR